MKHTLQSIVGTGYFGDNLKMTPADLEKVFGKAQYMANTGTQKVNYEWRLEHQGEVFTIYDYKEYSPLVGGCTYEFHVGFKSKFAAENLFPIIRNYIAQKLVG